MKEKISIIVPIYNVELYLERCVESIINQTYKNLEIILVDDGSPDNCFAICDKYEKLDSRVKVIHKENGGLSDARNAGLDIAEGEFIVFVDSDDYIDLKMCEKLINVVTDEVDIVAYGFRRFYDDKEQICKGTGNIEKVTGRELFEYYINRVFFTHMVCDKMFRRKLFDNVRFIKGRLAEDMAICYQLMGKSRGAIFVDENFYNYYMRSNSIMGTGSLKLCMDAYKGEYEAYSYGNQYYPEFKIANNTRLLNQSMKVYLKLTKSYKISANDKKVKMVKNRIKEIQKVGLPISTMGFYVIFTISKNLAWCLYKLFKMT